MGANIKLYCEIKTPINLILMVKPDFIGKKQKNMPNIHIFYKNIL